jgi:hypothetical protein
LFGKVKPITFRIGWELAPITRIVVELAKFDTQLLENPEISGVEYQQGTLAGYEIREYILEKWGRKCSYCDEKDAPLELEHIVARSRGGSNRPSNLCLACHPCNQRKGSSNIVDFLKDEPKRLAHILAYAKKPLRDAAAVNAIRNALARSLKATGLPVELTTGGRTKFNRIRFNIPKTHALDAACAGAVKAVYDWAVPTLIITSTGRGQRQRILPDSFGFPRGHRPRTKTAFGSKLAISSEPMSPKAKKPELISAE